MLGDQAIDSYSLERLALVKTQALNGKISDIETAKKAIIANETEPSNLYCANNIIKFKNSIPKQNWVLCLQSSGDAQL